MLASESGGLGAVHLLPLDPGIQNLHHEGCLLLGPSHILVQHARQEKELQMVGLGRENGNDIEAGGLGFVCYIDFASLDKVLIALHRVLTPYNKEVGRVLEELIFIRWSAIELNSPVTSIQASLEWKDCDLSVRSCVLGIDAGLVGQGSEPLFDEASVHNGALRGPVQP